MSATKATWKVTAGIILGQPIDDFNKLWTYTSEKHDQDHENLYPEIYHKMNDEAYEYARTLSNPGMINWVNVEFVWY